MRSISSKRVLLFVQLETQFNELMRVARLLRNTNSYNVLFCFYDLTPMRFSRMQALCAKEKIGYLLFNQDEADLVERKTSSYDVASKGTRVEKKWLKEIHGVNWLVFYGGQLKVILRGVIKGLAQFQKAKKIFLDQQPSALVVGEDGLGGPSIAIAVATSLRVPVLVVPYEYSTADQPAVGIVNYENYRQYYGMSTLINKLVAKMFPEWVYEYCGEKLLREPIARILTRKLLGISPYLPWAVHGGHATYISVENQFMFDHYLKQGIPLKKLQKVGSLYDDILYKYIYHMDEVDNDGARNYFINSEGKIKVLCAIPPDHIANCQTCEFKTYKDLVDFWINSLVALENVELLFQVHPRVTDEQSEYIKSKGVTLVHDDIAVLIPQCDILVTSVSSVIRLAIASKKIVVNYDVYKFYYKDYLSVGGVITFQSKDELALVLRKLITNKPFYDEVIALQSKEAENWGWIDGKAGERLLNFLEIITVGF